MKSASFETSKFDLVTAETMFYLAEIEKIKTITQGLRNALRFDGCQNS
jgi:hypothetical protein